MSRFRTDSAAETAGLPISATGLFDLVAVTVFVVIGRASHSEGLDIVGVLQTLWPFVIGAAAGWSIAYVYSHVRSSDFFGTDFRPDELAPAGVLVWVCTVAVGMVLRFLLHQGVAVSFVIVATIALGVFLLGWRGVRSGVARRRSTARTTARSESPT